MEYIVVYGLGFGLILMILFLKIFIKRMNKPDGGDKISNVILIFISGTSFFASVGLSIVIESIYYETVGTGRFVLGACLMVPLIIVLFVYMIVFISDIKQIKIDEQNKKNDQW